MPLSDAKSVSIRLRSRLLALSTTSADAMVGSPSRETMLRHFPARAERCVLLGADGFLDDPEWVPRHWTALRFGEMDVASFLGEIDFFVYFTNPMWRESFGRVIVEAIAAGKLVITDPGTA